MRSTKEELDYYQSLFGEEKTMEEEFEFYFPKGKYSGEEIPYELQYNLFSFIIVQSMATESKLHEQVLLYKQTSLPVESFALLSAYNEPFSTIIKDRLVHLDLNLARKNAKWCEFPFDSEDVTEKGELWLDFDDDGAHFDDSMFRETAGLVAPHEHATDPEDSLTVQQFVSKVTTVKLSDDVRKFMPLVGAQSEYDKAIGVNMSCVAHTVNVVALFPCPNVKREGLYSSMMEMLRKMESNKKRVLLEKLNFVHLVSARKAYPTLKLKKARAGHMVMDGLPPNFLPKVMKETVKDSVLLFHMAKIKSLDDPFCHMWYHGIALGKKITRIVETVRNICKASQICGLPMDIVGLKKNVLPVAYSIAVPGDDLVFRTEVGIANGRVSSLPPSFTSESTAVMDFNVIEFDQKASDERNRVMSMTLAVKNRKNLWSQVGYEVVILKVHVTVWLMQLHHIPDGQKDVRLKGWSLFPDANPLSEYVWIINVPEIEFYSSCLQHKKYLIMAIAMRYAYGLLRMPFRFYKAYYRPCAVELKWGPPKMVSDFLEEVDLTGIMPEEGDSMQSYLDEANAELEKQAMSEAGLNPHDGLMYGSEVFPLVEESFSSPRGDGVPGQDVLSFPKVDPLLHLEPIVHYTIKESGIVKARVLTEAVVKAEAAILRRNEAKKKRLQVVSVVEDDDDVNGDLAVMFK